ncbi:MAG TPA: MtrAB system histidine kinase MtrB [Micromonosporaceae bacterium]|nr:MtrAB system histidine kinase MtrB [Micromonosporaceae bacterium]
MTRLTRLLAVLDQSALIQTLRHGPVRRARRGSALLRRLWRVSLQFRMVSITLVLSALLVGTFGWLVATVIADGLLNAKIEIAKKQVENGGEYAANHLKVVTQRSDPALLATVPAIVATLQTAPELGNGVEVVMLRKPVAGADGDDLELPPESVARPHAGAYAEVRSPALAGLRRELSGTRMYWQYMTADPDGTGARPYLAFGTPVPSYGGDFQLYYLFPLDNEVELINLVRTTVAVTGVTLVALLAILTALVTRLVVRPVRVAARTAQRLSAGLLDQRMQVRGEDDLARLAAAFNQMAGNLQRQIIRLEEMSRMQRRFTSDVSHELRTPLTTVRMAADLIFSSRDDFDPAVARSAELLQHELDRFESLLTDLLEISRYDAGFAALDAEPTDLVPVIRRVADQLGPLAERSGSVLDVRVPDTAVIAEVDARRVERALRNLVGNAIEHGEGSQVLVTLGVDDCAVAVTVRDHGVGLKPGEEKLVFNRFWRADPSRARQTGGTGLGLSISLEDARLHGGWLEAWGEPGKGAQFRLTLPVRAGDRLADSPLPLVPQAPGGRPIALAEAGGSS